MIQYTGINIVLAHFCWQNQFDLKFFIVINMRALITVCNKFYKDKTNTNISIEIRELWHLRFDSSILWNLRQQNAFRIYTVKLIEM